TSGLRVVDVQNVATGRFAEVAHFDTHQQNDSYAYNGQWMNYPYFASGIVVATDIQNGLFVLRPTGLAVASSDGPADGATGYALSVPVPNPTAGGARLTLSVDAVQSVTASVYDVTGRRVATVFEGPAAPGATVQIDVDGSALPPGVYVVRVTGERFAASRRLVLTR
ncbi:MAG TPA: T9SS type A sorting domain-containing protein, partial [Rubricoccaceae bacterium]